MRVALLCFWQFSIEMVSSCNGRDLYNVFVVFLTCKPVSFIAPICTRQTRLDSTLELHSHKKISPLEEFNEHAIFGLIALLNSQN